LSKLTLPFDNALRITYESLLRPPAGWLSSLGGLRAIAVLLVLNHHFGAAFASEYGENAYTKFALTRDGWIGVDLFFVLSGFLIGGQLWKEIDRSGNVSVGRFVLRRGLRIWPLYFAVYAAMVALELTRGTRHGALWPDLFFLADYFRSALVPGGWSLCIEEQFYLLAPLLLMVIATRLRNQAQRTFLWALFIAEPVIRAIEWAHFTGSVRNSQNPEAFATLYFNFHTHCDGLIIGLIISNLWQRGRAKQGQAWNPGATVLIAILAAGVLAISDKVVFGYTGLALIFGSMVWFCVSRSGAQLFTSKIFWISQLSFGIYMNHQIVLGVVLSRILPHIACFSPGSTAQLLVALGMTVLLSSFTALITYCLIEQPALQFRGSLERRARGGAEPQ
jgi:peptidoglycan/LPS O-acetylase OafA/YrhL